ncbi:neural cell adhesion molecule 1-like isoform X2 [Penaeus japonicus]|uniref:neural cell adhesion molecule 1-like isoform X2 n=1 Tax=Penaeus japonicus TaxID=27405 RepID=UPI001C70B5D7|nr:neural cell adhesion molecule 1-like isoform X2 [Penaeus japonicus]
MRNLQGPLLLLLLGIISVSVTEGRIRWGGLGAALALRSGLRYSSASYRMSPRAEAYSFFSRTRGSDRKENLVIKPQGKIQTVFKGESFFVSCSSDADNVQRVMWTGPEGQQITDYRGRIHVEDGRSGHKGVDLIFTNISRKDRGKYTCSANVDGVEEERSFNLTVLKHLDFMDTPTTQYLEEDHDSVLRCDVDGDPAPRVSWNINNRKVTYGTKYEKGTEHPNDLVVRNATLQDAGLYKCVALQLSNFISEVKELAIEVKVHHKPQWRDNDNMAQAYGYVTGDVNLTCEAVAEPHANFTWIKDNQIIEPNDTVQIINEDHKSVLRLKVTDVDMFGDYVCKAENKLGTLERVIILEEGKKPAVPEAKVTEAEVNAITLELDAHNHPDMPILAFRVQYKTAGDSWSNAQSMEFKRGDPYVINSLTGDTLYVLRASAKNAAGYSDFSSDFMKRTKKIHESQSQISAGNSLSAAAHVLIPFFLLLASLL